MRESKRFALLPILFPHAARRRRVVRPRPAQRLGIARRRHQSGHGHVRSPSAFSSSTPAAVAPSTEYAIIPPHANGCSGFSRFVAVVGAHFAVRRLRSRSFFTVPHFSRRFSVGRGKKEKKGSLSGRCVGF